MVGLNNSIDLDRIGKEEACSVATSLLYSLRKEPKYSVMSELFYILDYPNFIRMIKYFGGETIRIPSSEEINYTLRIMLLYQYYKVEELSWDDSVSRSGLSDEPVASLKAKITSLEKILKNIELGRENYEQT